MRRFFAAIVVLLCAMQSVVAQDVLITTDGEVMTVYIDDIGSSAIYYKEVNSSNSSLQRIDKAKVYMIKKADGTKYDLGNAQTPANQSSTPTAEQPMNTESSEAAKQRNKELIDAQNQIAVQPEFKGTPSDKNALGVYATLGVCDNSIMCNDDLELSFESSFGYVYTIKDEFVLTVTNRTNKTIFIDLANTFLVCNGESSPYYVPVAYSSSVSKSGDANAGTFAGAMGIHDYQTSVSTSTVYSQRIISIPPMAKKRLDSKWLFPARSHLCCPGLFFHWAKFQGKSYSGIIKFYFGEKKSPNTLKEGETFIFSQDNSPLKFTCHVTYSFIEDCEVTNSIFAYLFMKKVIGYGTSFKGNWLTEKDIDYTSAPFFSAKVEFENSRTAFGGFDFEGTVFKRP